MNDYERYERNVCFYTAVLTEWEIISAYHCLSTPGTRLVRCFVLWLIIEIFEVLLYCIKFYERNKYMAYSIHTKGYTISISMEGDLLQKYGYEDLNLYSWSNSMIPEIICHLLAEVLLSLHTLPVKYKWYASLYIFVTW